MAYHKSHVMNLFEGLEIRITAARRALKQNAPSVVALAVERALAWCLRPDDEMGFMAALKHRETWKDKNSEDMQARAQYRLEIWHEFCKRDHIFIPWYYIENEDLRAELRQEQYEAHYA